MERSSEKQGRPSRLPSETSKSGRATALTDIQQLLSKLSEETQDLLCTHDFEGRLLSVSQAPARILGYTVDELLRMTLPELLAPEFRSQFPDYLARIRKEGVASGPMMLLTRSGERRIWEYHNKLHTEGQASPMVLGMAHDITERVRAEQALRASEKKFRSIFQDAPLPMVLGTTQGRLTECNQSFCDFLGYSRAELLGKTILEITYPDDVASSFAIIERFRSGQQTISRHEKRYLHKSGEPKWGEVSVSLVPGHQRGSQYFLAQILDISERKRAEEQQKSNLQKITLLWKLSHLVSSGVSVDQVAHAATDGVISHIAGDVALLFEKQGEDLQMRALSSREARFQPDVPITHCLGQCLCGLAARGCQPLYCIDIVSDPRCTWEECKKAGLHSFAALPLKDEGQVIGVLGIGSVTAHDFGQEATFLETLAAEVSAALTNCLLRKRLTERATQLEQEVAERKRAQEALQDREERLRMMIHQLPGVLWTVDRDLRFTSSSGKGLKQLGETEDQVRGMSLARYVDNDDPDYAINSSHRRALRGESVSHEFEFNGRSYEVLVGPLRDAEGAIVGALGVAIDITELRQKTQRLQTLLEVSLNSAAHLEPGALFSAVSSPLQSAIDQDLTGLFVWDAVESTMRPVAIDFPSAESDDCLLEIGEDFRHAEIFSFREIKVLDSSQLVDDVFLAALHKAGIRSLCCVPLATGDGPQGTLLLGSRSDNAFGTSNLELLAQVAPQLAMALANARAYQEIKRLKEKLSEEKIYLEKEVESESRFDEIVGGSRTLKAVLDLVSIVAPTDANVLITGETGTGKELIARAIHRMSPRAENSFIKLNCAAIPTGLLESELFGFERGAFTSAADRKIGRIELADQGTLFLDEIGELPLELQPKLLHALEDHEFERLGSTKIVRVNIRLIAATNRDLAKEVTSGAFRADLFFRLNVFPIRMPPLRDRRSDIPSLITHFVHKYSARMKKRIDSIPKETMNILARWDWAGNIRELENFIERSVILTSGTVLEAPLSELAIPPTGGPGTLQTNIEAIQRDQIIRALREAGGVISGPTGAAARLGIKRTTLQSMVQRFGIPIEKYRTGPES